MAEARRLVRRLDELVTDEQIDSVIDKYKLGQEVWWQREFVNAMIPIMDAATGAEIEINLPVTYIFLGMPGHFPGPAHYVWWVVTLDAYPTMDKVDQMIMAALEAMREKKATQVNGSIGKS
jgi:hypothetical protein